MMAVCEPNIISDERTIANWLLSKQAMTPKKLQKMLYYCYSWTLALMNEDKSNLNIKLFDSEFEAWVHGPVIREIYSAYRDYGYNEIEKVDDDVKIDNPDVENILEQVFEIYSGYNGNQLESISHQETPWINGRKGLEPFEATNRIILDEDIFEYYNAQTG